MDDGVHFSVDASAEFVAFTPGNVSLLTGTDTEIGTIHRPSRRTCVTGGNYLIIINNYCAVTTPETSRTTRHLTCYIKIIMIFVRPYNHAMLLFFISISLAK